MTSRIVKVLMLLLVFVAARGVWAQEVAATLTGTVADATGAIIPNATVDIHSDAMNTSVRNLKTNSQGSFTATNIPAGTYTVTVTSSGFSTFVDHHVILNVAEQRNLEVHLTSGQVSQTVDVQSMNTPIQTTTSEESGTVTGTQVRELALNNRNFEQLVLLQPGVASKLPDEVGFGLGNSTTISVNGARSASNNWTVDGADINDSGSNATLLNVPSLDAIQEFTLERSSYGAQYGRSAGGQVLVATKAGTDKFFGSAYEFNRNNFFNANTILGAASHQPTPIERYNDFGFTLGGPLFIPKLFHPQNDKTYFFWSEEWRKASSPGENVINVPTAAQLQGTFTSKTPLVAPANCVTSSSAGVYSINPSCYSKNAAVYLKNIYDVNPANAGGGTLLTTNYSSLNNYRQDLVRLDQNVTSKVHAFARYMEDVVPQNRPFGLWGGANFPGVEVASINAPGRNLVANVTWTLSPSVVNETEYVDSWGAINSTLQGTANSPAFLSQLTNKTAYQDPNHRAPNVAISGVTGLANGSAPYFERNIDQNVFDNLSINVGRHTLRTGFTVMFMTKTENSSSGAATFSFTGTNGNPSFANFLLGQADYYTQPNRDMIPDLKYVNFEGYVQDDWKASARVTVNLGLRYSYFPSPTDLNNILVNFDPLVYNPKLAPAIDPKTGKMVAGQSATAANYGNGLIFPVGTACNSAKAISPTVSCSPFGARVNPNSNNNWAPRVGIAWDVFGNNKTAVRAGYGIFFDRTLNGIWEQNAFDDPPLVQTTTINNDAAASLNIFDNPTAGTAAGAPLGPNSLVATGTPTFKVPSSQAYNLSVQQEVAPGTVVEVAYVGTRGVHLLGDVNINQPTLGTRQANPTVDVNAIVPYQGFGVITSRIPTFMSNYNSLQVSMNRQFNNGITAQLAYTFSKLLTNMPIDRGLGVYNTYDFSRDYGPSILNTPQMFVASYVYDEPFYKSQEGVVGRLLGGWELSGIVTMHTGQSTYVRQTSDPFAADPGGLGMTRSGSSILILPDEVGNPHGPKTAAQYFNTSAFVPAVGHFGSEHPGSFLGPGYQIWDTSLMKNIKATELVRFQFRLETFNTFNHGSPSSIDTTLGDTSYGRVTGYHDPRNIQLGGKMYF